AGSGAASRARDVKVDRNPRIMKRRMSASSKRFPDRACLSRENGPQFINRKMAVEPARKIRLEINGLADGLCAVELDGGRVISDPVVSGLSDSLAAWPSTAASWAPSAGLFGREDGPQSA